MIDLNTKNVIIDEFNLLKAIQADSTKYVSLNALYESKLSQLEHISSRLETVQSQWNCKEQLHCFRRVLI